LPQHKALQIPELMPYPQEVIGRKVAAAGVKVLPLNPPIAQKFHDLWLSAGGG